MHRTATLSRSVTPPSLALPALVALRVLSACAARDVIATDVSGYVSDIDQWIASVDWNEAKTANVTRSKYDFTPGSRHFQ